MGRRPAERSHRWVRSRLLRQDEEATRPTDPAETEQREKDSPNVIPEFESLSEFELLSEYESEGEMDVSSDSERIRRRKSFCSKKSVSFTKIEVRNYNVVIGDHPCCTMGCPLSLGWEYSDSKAQPLEQYEASREPRRKRSDLVTTCEQRREILSQDGYSNGEIRKAQRKLHRARSSNSKLSERMNDKFFQAEFSSYSE